MKLEALRKLFRRWTTPVNPRPIRVDEESAAVAEDRHDIRAAQAALAEIEQKGTIPWEKVKSDLGL